MEITASGVPRLHPHSAAVVQDRSYDPTVPSVGTDHLRSLKPSVGHRSTWTSTPSTGMDLNRIRCVPLQSILEPLEKPGHVEELGRGLLSPSVGSTCSNSLLADQKHLHVQGEGEGVEPRWR